MGGGGGHSDPVIRGGGGGGVQKGFSALRVSVSLLHRRFYCRHATLLLWEERCVTRGALRDDTKITV